MLYPMLKRTLGMWNYCFVCHGIAIFTMTFSADDSYFASFFLRYVFGVKFVSIKVLNA